MNIDDLMNIVRREAERVVERRASGIRIGTVSSYDPATHSVKLELQPEGTESGWCPLSAVGVGSGAGVFVGPSTGQAMLAYFHEGDVEAGVIIGRLATDANPPVNVLPGEIVAVTPFGSALKLLANGGASLTSAGGSSVSCDPTGTITMTGVAGQTIVMDVSGNIILTPTMSGKVKLGGASASVAIARNGDAVSSSHVVATSTEVVSL